MIVFRLLQILHAASFIVFACSLVYIFSSLSCLAKILIFRNAIGVSNRVKSNSASARASYLGSDANFREPLKRRGTFARRIRTSEAVDGLRLKMKSSVVDLHGGLDWWVEIDHRTRVGLGSVCLAMVFYFRG